MTSAPGKVDGDARGARLAARRSGGCRRADPRFSRSRLRARLGRREGRGRRRSRLPPADHGLPGALAVSPGRRPYRRRLLAQAGACSGHRRRPVARPRARPRDRPPSAPFAAPSTWRRSRVVGARNYGRPVTTDCRSWLKQDCQAEPPDRVLYPEGSRGRRLRVLRAGRPDHRAAPERPSVHDEALPARDHGRGLLPEAGAQRDAGLDPDASVPHVAA